MASSGTDSNGAEARAVSKRAGGARPEEKAPRVAGEQERVARRFPEPRVDRAERDRMVAEARAITFPVTVRGYERGAVDRYVQHVNRLIAELEISSSSESAVRHALAEVSEETREILQRAHETADEIVLRSRAKADDTVQEAEREAHQIQNTAQREAIAVREAARQEADEVLATARHEAEELRDAATREATELRETAGLEAERGHAAAKAEADRLLREAHEQADELLKVSERHAHELGENADQIWRERRRLIEDLRLLGEQLLALGDAESKRYPRPPEKAGATMEHVKEPQLEAAELVTSLHEVVRNTPSAGDATS